jgi:hypothetical protein
MSYQGGFSEEALSAYAQLVAEGKGVDFSEGGVYDFARCVRPDGTAYGTSGKCRKGSEEAKKEEVPKERKPRAKKASKPLEAQRAGKTSAPKAKAKAKAKKLLADKKDSKPVNPAISERKTEEEPKNERNNAPSWRDTQDKLEIRQRKVIPNLEAKDVRAIRDYAGGQTGEGGRSYKGLNKCLRQRLPCLNSVHREHAKHLDAVLKKLPANTDGDVFYRGMAVEGKAAQQLYDRLRKAKPGTTLKDPGFSSYTSDKGWAEVFQTSAETNKSILFVSRNKELRPMNLLSRASNEYEAILPRGTKTTIRKVTEDGDTLIVEVD